MSDVSVQNFEAGDRVRLLATIGDLPEGHKGTVLATQDDQLEVRADGSLDDYLVPADKVERIIPLTQTTVPTLPDATDIGNGVTAVQAREAGWTEDEIREAAAVAEVQGQREAAHLQANQPLLAELLKQGSTGNMEMTRSLYDIRFVRSGTPEELLEVEKHIRGMIDQGLSYRFMERFLMTMGYLPHTIRRSFKNLTGIRPEDVVNYENYFMSPGSIPTFNMGWGKSKGGKGWHFIMPMTTYYGIFNQVDDRTRVEVSRHPELIDAIDACRKLVSHLERWDPPVKDTKREDIVPSEMYRQPQLYMSASANQLERSLMTIPSKPLRAGLVLAAFRNGLITDAERTHLMSVYAEGGDVVEEGKAKNKAEQAQDAIEKETAKPARDDSNASPDDIAREIQREQGGGTPVSAEMDKAISEKVSDLNASLGEFQVSIVSTTNKKITPAGRPGAMSDERDTLNGTAMIIATLQVVDQTLPAPKPSDKTKKNTKLGVVMLSIVNGQPVIPKGFKSVDDQKVYNLDEDGFQMLFAVERAAQRPGTPE